MIWIQKDFQYHIFIGNQSRVYWENFEKGKVWYTSKVHCTPKYQEVLQGLMQI